MAYLLHTYENMSLFDAFQLVATRRRIWPNDGFCRHLNDIINVFFSTKINKSFCKKFLFNLRIVLLIICFYLIHLLIMNNLFDKLEKTFQSHFKQNLSIPQYYWYDQKSTNSFGDVAFLIHNSLKSKVIMKQDNFLLIELEIADESDLLIGAVYIPPKCLLPFDLFKVFIYVTLNL